MKTFTFAVSLIFLSAACSAQVYTFKPKYSCQIIYSGGDQNELWFDRITTPANNTCIVDLDKKTVSAPGSVFPEPRTYDIAEIKRDDDKGLITLKMKVNKETGQVWSYYELKLDKDANPVYLRSVERLSGKRFREDTFFHMFTSDLSMLSFYRQCKQMKQNTALSTNKETRDKEIAAIAGVAMGEEDNTLEMRNGYVYWSEGKEKKAIQRRLLIDSTFAMQDATTKGVMIKCHERDDEFYIIMYMNTNRHLDPGQYTWQRFFMIYRYINNVHKEVKLVR